MGAASLFPTVVTLCFPAQHRLGLVHLKVSLAAIVGGLTTKAEPKAGANAAATRAGEDGGGDHRWAGVAVLLVPHKILEQFDEYQRKFWLVKPKAAHLKELLKNTVSNPQ